jgi:hypothetical protein
MTGFYFRLELADGTPADPPVLHTAAPNWQAGDTIPLAADRMLRVVEMRFVDDDPVLVVETACGRSLLAAEARAVLHASLSRALPFAHT